MGNVRARWALMTLYERFERMVAIALSLIIAILILIALVQLYERPAAGAGRSSRST